MTLTELRARYPALFLRNQDWFANESFMRVLPNERRWTPPTRIVALGKKPKTDRGLPLAVDVAHAFVIDPEHPIWSYYIWCRDKDANKQRVFVGVNDGKFEIHRHLHITTRFGCARWD